MTENTRAVRSIKKTAWGFLLLWTVALAACCGYQLYGQSSQSLELVRVIARTSHDKDVLYRLWNSMHGGVYVPVSALADPNPYLDVPRREITDSSGRTYTLINPAYMTRQAHEIMAKQQGITGHITSLDPIRPGNAPDDWEREALILLRDNKLEEYSSLTDYQGKSSLRLIKPLYVGETCMPCHAKQGYKIGQLRGGISVTVPMAPYAGLFMGAAARTGGIYLILWAIGAYGIRKGSRFLIREISERLDELRDKEGRLAVSDANLRRIIENAPEGILIHNGEGFTFANQQARTILGVDSPADLSAEAFKAITPEHCAESADLSECRSSAFETILPRQDGTPLYLEISMVALADASSSTRLFYLKDATRRKEDEIALKESKARAEDANRAKTAFLANMSHEIRTPLNGVMGMLQLLQMQEEDQEKRNCVDTALECSNKLLVILNDILDLARIESGCLELSRNVFPPKAMLREIAFLLKPQAESKGIALTVDIDEGVPDLVSADEGRMRQILFNLLSNAVKFTDRGEVVASLTFTADRRTPGGVKLIFGVEDTGPGIARDMMDYVFESFTQVDAKYTRRHGGVGLGLAIVKRLSKLLGADLCMESDPGQGSFFYMGFPAVIKEEPRRERSVASVAPAPAPAMPGAPLVLVVDDDLPSQTLLASCLKRLGCRYASVMSATQALAYLRDNQADLILTDVQMPGMSGLEMTRLIRDAGGALAATPIVAVTAHALEGDKDMFLSAGMDAYLCKPVNVAELEALLLRFFRKASPSG